MSNHEIDTAHIMNQAQMAGLFTYAEQTRQVRVLLRR
jgi:hypothetical protein